MTVSAITYTRVTNFDSADDFTKKHTPFITAERDGDKVTVTVEVGHEVPHPNQADHYITFVELYAEMAPIARFDFFPGVTWPKVTVVAMLPANTPLTALEHCNLHGVWAYEQVV